MSDNNPFPQGYQVKQQTTDTPLDIPHHDIPDRHRFGDALELPITVSAVGKSYADDVGTSNAPARSDHVHKWDPGTVFYRFTQSVTITAAASVAFTITFGQSFIGNVDPLITVVNGVSSTMLLAVVTGIYSDRIEAKLFTYDKTTTTQTVTVNCLAAVT